MNELCEYLEEYAVKIENLRGLVNILNTQLYNVSGDGNNDSALNAAKTLSDTLVELMILRDNDIEDLIKICMRVKHEVCVCVMILMIKNFPCHFRITGEAISE